MVWGFFPVDPLSGEEKFYVFAPGKYKVGRKGCDLTITKDKGVSRIHAEIVVDAMIYKEGYSSNVSSKVRICDCSKYGTFVSRNSGLKEKIHELPKNEAGLYDGDVVSFGSGNATYRFSFVKLLFYVHRSESFQFQLLRDKVSSIGASTSHGIQECTHVLVEELMSFDDTLVDAIVAEKPFVLTSWVEGKPSVTRFRALIRKLLPFSYHPTMTVEGMHVKVVDPNTRRNCLSGYIFLLGSRHMQYKYGDRLKMLLQQVGGANVLSIEDFSSDSQDGHGENGQVVFVTPGGSAEKLDSFYKIDSYYKINELVLVSTVLSGKLDRDNLIPPCEPVSSTCSTDETVVAESDLEAETAKPVHAASNVQEPNEYLSKPEVSIVNATATGLVGGHETFKDAYSGVETRIDKVDDSDDNRNINIIYRQDLIVRHAMKPPTIVTTENSGVANFKRFRKRETDSGNSFYNLVPFGKFPYKDSANGSEEMVESLKEERKRKEKEAVAEDLFHNEKGRRRGMVGYLQELFTRT